jgi:hypothetical protein
MINSLASPYAVGEYVSFYLGAGSSLNYSASTTLTNVPEPGSMLLLGSGLVGLAGAVRRRLKK